MYERTHKRSLLQRMAWFIALMMAAALIAVTMIYSTHAGDCWGGALSEDQFNCYILEEAQKAGVIDVEAVYQVGRERHIYISQTSPLDDEVKQVLMEKATEFIDRWPNREFYNESVIRNCEYLEGHMEPIWECVLWDAHGLIYHSALPMSNSYAEVELHTGGADARMGETGWRGYHQLWPPTDRMRRSANRFDVSEVDTTNFPPIDCRTERLVKTTCRMSLEFPDLHIAGFHSTEGTSGKAYVQVKTPPGGEVDRDAVKEELISQYTFATKDDYIIIPVKHSYEELWRWNEIITRFSNSSGNTLGITWSFIGPNKDFSRGESVLPLAHLQAIARGNSEFRETIHIWTLNLQETVDALPQLLGQLGIPVDAVGVVGETPN